MKRRIGIGLIVWFLCCACSSTTHLSIPFSASVYQSSSEYVRAVSHGESANEALAERIAIHTAQTELSSLIQAFVKNVNAEFNSIYSDSESKEWKSTFEKEEISISQQTMSKLKVVEKKEILRKDGLYEIWVVVELPRKSLMDGFEQLFSASRLKSVEDKKRRFQQVFDGEWTKLLH